MQAHYFQRLSIKRSRQNGSLIILFCSMIFVAILLIMLAFNIWKLLFQHQSSQSVTDFAVLNSAQILNENDSIGRMNNIVILSRELVFDSRAEYNVTSDPNRYFLEPLARQLLNQARYGASVVEEGRKQLIVARLNEVEQAIESDPSLNSQNAKIINLEVGTAGDSKSNAYDDCADELQDFDKQKRFVDLNSHRFLGNINAKLPGDDADLIFKISPLRDVIQGQIQQSAILNKTVFVGTAKLIKNGEHIKRINCDQMPCAVSVQIAFPLGKVIGMDNEQDNLLVSSAAQTHGGQPMP